MIDKILGRDGQHPSRIHSRRGELAHIGELMSLLPALRDRAVGRRSDSPWIAPSAVAALNLELQPEDVMVELGGGASTRWFADRVLHIFCVEPNELWANRISSNVDGLHNVTLLRMPIAQSGPQIFRSPSVVLIDHDEVPGDLTRPEAALEMVRLFGDSLRLIVLDDSDRPEYREVEPMLQQLGYRFERFRGFRKQPLHLTETTVFRKGS